MSDKEKAAAAKALGNAAFTAKNYAEAVEHFTEAISHDPSDHVFFSNRSACLASLGQYGRALEDGAECVRLKPDWAKGYTRKGLAEFFLERYDDAAETYKAGLKLAPNDPSLKEGLQKAMDAKYEVPGAKHSAGSNPRGAGMAFGNPFGGMDSTGLDRASVSNPNIKEYLKDPEVMKKLNTVIGMSSSAGGEMQQKLLMDLLRQDPRVLEVFMAAQGIQMRCGDDFASAERPVDVDSTNTAKRPPAESDATPAVKRQRGEDAAKPPSQPAAPADPRTDKQREADDFKDQGNKLYKQRKFEEALAMYDKAIEKEPNDLTYYHNKCAVWIELGEESYSKVLETCQDLIERRYEINTANSGGASFEKVAKVYARMASVYERQGKFDEAAEMYNKSLTEDNNRHVRTALRELERVKEKWEQEQYVDPKLAEEHRERGNEFFKSNDFAKAKLEYDEAIRRNPADVKLFSNRAAAFTKLLAYPDALRDLEECLRLDPKFVKAYSRKGAAHFLMKEYNKALAAYDNGLEIDKTNEECLKGREQVLSKIMETQRSDEIDEEQVRHAMADPEIQQILKDPKMRDFLRQLQENPTEAKQAMRSDDRLRDAVSKLMAAGIVRAR